METRTALFVAPEGAMQFEITQGWDGMPCPEKYVPFVIWVYPMDGYGPKESKPDCPHTDAYAILRCGLDTVHLAGLGTAEKVCECVGRIIE